MATNFITRFHFGMFQVIKGTYMNYKHTVFADDRGEGGPVWEWEDPAYQAHRHQQEEHGNIGDPSGGFTTHDFLSVIWIISDKPVSFMVMLAFIPNDILQGNNVRQIILLDLSHSLIFRKENKIFY